MKKLFLFIIVFVLFASHSVIYGKDLKYDYTLTLANGGKVHVYSDHSGICKYIVSGIKCERNLNSSIGNSDTDNIKNLSSVTFTQIRGKYSFKFGKTELLLIDSKDSQLVKELTDQIKLAKMKITSNTKEKK